MELVDTHCHLYLDEFKTDIDSVIERAKKIGVK
jgi:Tat protein secretion system quality control protein TatD with DNase activity